MTTDATIADLRPRTAKHLRTLADDIDALNDHSDFYVWQQPFAQISEEWATQMHAKLNTTLGAQCQSIYSLHLVDGPDAQSILADLKAERGKGTHKYPRLGAMDDCRNSTTLYVGSSKTTPSRMLQHLGKCAPSTYGLRLSRWTTHWPGSLRIEVRTFDKIDAALLQILEDHLAYLLRPITGKRGSK